MLGERKNESEKIESEKSREGEEALRRERKSK
jgi:hypothetical protein